jgi:hypothetical protein
MYRDYIDFFGEYFPRNKFDFVFIDGHAQPQIVYTISKQLNNDQSKVFFP